LKIPALDVAPKGGSYAPAVRYAEKREKGEMGEILSQNPSLKAKAGGELISGRGRRLPKHAERREPHWYDHG